MCAWSILTYSFIYFNIFFLLRKKVFIDNFAINGLGACNTLLALTTFLTIKFKIPIDKKKRYLIGYALFAIGYPLIVSYYPLLHLFTLILLQRLVQ